MKLQIESTTQILEIDGVPVRIWRGITPGGQPCDVLVHRIGAPDGSPAMVELERELAEVATPKTLIGPLDPDTPGVEYFDEDTGRDLKLALAGIFTGWLFSLDDEGDWMPLRLATRDDLFRIQDGFFDRRLRTDVGSKRKNAKGRPVTSDDSEIEKKLVGTKGMIIGDHPYAGETGVIVRIDDTPWGRRPVVRMPDMGGHECFVLASTEWYPLPQL